MLEVRGKVKLGKRTKDLVKRLQLNEIAVIDHQDLDEVAALSLARGRIKGVINASLSISGRYPNPGPEILLQKGIPLLDNVGKEIMEILQEGDYIGIIGNNIYRNGELLAQGQRLTLSLVRQKMQEADRNLDQELDKFLANTLEHAAKEKELIMGKLDLPSLTTNLKGKHVLIVVRGKNYQEDLAIIRPYIEEVKPVLIGVDGGADVLLEAGYLPQVIIGDMDSVLDKTLKCGAELIVHAYLDGQAPGLSRIEELGLTAKVFPAPGTSEDIALLLAYQKGAALLVAVGTHTSMLDFLEKGRKGMASTFLVRLKVGSILVDAKGVSQLYGKRVKMGYILLIFLAALIPVGVILGLTPTTQQILRLLFLNWKVICGL